MSKNNDEKKLNQTMEEVFYRCIRCNNIAYEVKKNNYYCPKCKFEWETY